MKLIILALFIVSVISVSIYLIHKNWVRKSERKKELCRLAAIEKVKKWIGYDFGENYIKANYYTRVDLYADEMLIIEFGSQEFGKLVNHIRTLNNVNDILHKGLIYIEKSTIPQIDENLCDGDGSIETIDILTENNILKYTYVYREGVTMFYSFPPSDSFLN